MIVSKFIYLINDFEPNEYPPHNDGMMGFGWWGWMIIMMAFWLLIGILLGVWVYHDAENRGANGALWLIIVFFTMLIGLIIWLIVRPQKQASKVELKEKVKELEKVLICPYCKAENSPDSHFCVNCGSSLIWKKLDPTGKAIREVYSFSSKASSELLSATVGSFGLSYWIPKSLLAIGGVLGWFVSILKEIYRVLKAGGKAFFLEHMLPKSRIIQPVFHVLNPVFRMFRPEINRKTDVNIKKAGFEIIKEENLLFTVFRVIEAKKDWNFMDIMDLSILDPLGISANPES